MAHIATPSSSATSPSPALSFAIPATASDASADDSPDQDLAQREERRKKIIARTEFAKITRALRSTLALASYKARHNVVDVPLRSLEAQIAQHGRAASAAQGSRQGSPMAFSSPAEKKRKANASLNNTGYYNSPLAQGSGYQHMGGNASSSSMGMLSPEQTHAYSPTSATPSSANATKSLFASILSFPPAKRARTIHNPEAPPVPPPLPPSHAQSRHAAQKSPKKTTSKKGKEPAGHGKGKVAAKEAKGKERAAAVAAAKGAKGRGRANSISSTRTRSSFGGETENVNDTDIKAAATLTDLLFSRAGGTASPRSSFSAPTSASRMAPAAPGANHALPISQSSSMSSATAATVAPRHNTHVRTGSNASTASTATGILERESYAQQQQQQQYTDVAMNAERSQTPTGSRAAGPSSGPNANIAFGIPSAPVQRAADSEAADLMLLLANSPSPARPPVPRDQDITRNVYAAGRVLFPSSSGNYGSNNNGHGLDPGGARGRGLTRSMGGASASFSSVLSNESDESRERGRRSASASTSMSPPLTQAKVNVSSPSAGAEAGIMGPPTPDSVDEGLGARQHVPQALSLGQLLPSPPSPTRAGPMTPVTGFNMGDYINITPSPAAPSSAQTQAQQASHAASASNTASSFPLPSHPTSTGFQIPPSQSALSQPAQPASSSSSTAAAVGAVGGTPGRFRSAVSVSSPLRKSFDREGMGTGIGAGGRKLFENEPGGGGGGDNKGGGTNAGGMNGGGPGRKIRFGEEGPGTGVLGSGIDLVQT